MDKTHPATVFWKEFAWPVLLCAQTALLLCGGERRRWFEAQKVHELNETLVYRWDPNPSLYMGHIAPPPLEFNSKHIPIKEACMQKEEVAYSTFNTDPTRDFNVLLNE